MNSNYKSQLIEDRSQFMHPLARQIMKEMIEWLKSEGVDPVITETVTTLIEDARMGRKSDSHREGRAWDVRTRDWPRDLVKRFETRFESAYGKLGAIGATTKMPNFMLFHDSGHGEHFHCQLSKVYSMKIPKNMDQKKKIA